MSYTTRAAKPGRSPGACIIAGTAHAIDAAYHVAEIVKTPMMDVDTTSTTCIDGAPTTGAPPKHEAWSSKPGVRFDIKAGSLFGARIRMHGRLAVIKSWTPCSHAFGIVFDDTPDKVFREDLARSMKWHLVDWEGDVWQTASLRPMCPTCGHPLGVGLAAWTKCGPCGQMEPGATSTEMFSRLRTGDPYR